MIKQIILATVTRAQSTSHLSYWCYDNNPKDSAPNVFWTTFVAPSYSFSFQIGLSFFVHSDNQNSYESNSYNFYVCPRSFLNHDPRFLCQASSLEFLAEHKFDFNKVNERKRNMKSKLVRKTTTKCAEVNTNKV